MPGCFASERAVEPRNPEIAAFYGNLTPAIRASVVCHCLFPSFAASPWPVVDGGLIRLYPAGNACRVGFAGVGPVAGSGASTELTILS